MHQEGYRVDEIEGMYPYEIDVMRTLSRQHQARMAEVARQARAAQEAAKNLRF